MTSTDRRVAFLVAGSATGNGRALAIALDFVYLYILADVDFVFLNFVALVMDFIDYVTGIGNSAFRASGPCCAQNAFCLTPGFQV